MAERFASPFDDLLNIGRRQLEELAELAGAPPERGKARAADAAGHDATPAPRTDTVVSGTASGVRFTLRVGA